MSQMTTADLLALPPTIDLVTAARALGCGRTLAYELARRGRFPCRVLRLGNRYLIPTADLLRTLGVEARGKPETPPSRLRSATEQRLAPARPPAPACCGPPACAAC